MRGRGSLDAGRGLVCGRQRLEQDLRELRSDAGLFVLEVYEHVAAVRGALADHLRPARQVLGLVALVTEAEVAIAGGDFHGGGELLAVGDAQSDVPGA